MPSSTIEVRKNVALHYYFTLIMPKHDAGFVSQAYKSREALLDGMASLRSSVGFNNRYERLVSPRKELYFALRAHDNIILGTSAMFSSEDEREKAIMAMKRYARTAEIRWVDA